MTAIAPNVSEELRTQTERHTRGIVQFPTEDLGLDEDSFAHRRILVTGGASGIGEACSRRLASLGAEVVLADRNEELGTKLEQDMTASGWRVKFIPVDVTSWESQVNLFQSAVQFFTGHELDVLIPCAGIVGSSKWDITPTSPDKLFEQQDPLLLRPPTACLDIGLIGAMYSLHIAVKYCMGLSPGQASGEYQLPTDKCVILIGSTAGYSFIPSRPDYTGIKWGLRGVFRCYRGELPKYGARINLLAPSYLDTPLTHSYVSVLKEKGMKFGRIEDLVRGVTHILLDRSMNGKCPS